MFHPSNKPQFHPVHAERRYLLQVIPLHVKGVQFKDCVYYYYIGICWITLSCSDIHTL